MQPRVQPSRWANSGVGQSCLGCSSEASVWALHFEKIPVSYAHLKVLLPASSPHLGPRLLPTRPAGASCLLWLRGLPLGPMSPALSFPVSSPEAACPCPHLSACLGRASFQALAGLPPRGPRSLGRIGRELRTVRTAVSGVDMPGAASGTDLALKESPGQTLPPFLPNQRMSGSLAGPLLSPMRLRGATCWGACRALRMGKAAVPSQPQLPLPPGRLPCAQGSWCPVPQPRGLWAGAGARPPGPEGGGLPAPRPACRAC